MTVYQTPGNVGIQSKRIFLFVCGGHHANLEIDAEDLEEAKAVARALHGWRNGFSNNLGAMSGARGTPSTWRCDECVAESRRYPLVYFPKLYEWRRVPPAPPQSQEAP